MTARERLIDIRRINAAISVNEAEYKRILELATRVSPSISADVVQHSGSGDKVGELVAKMADISKSLEHDIEELVDTQQDMLKVITKLPALEMQVVYKRYFEAKGWYQIAVEMCYDERQVRRIHGQAMELLADAETCPRMSENVRKCPAES